MGGRQRFDRRSLRLLATPARPIGLGHDAHHNMPGRQQRGESGDGELGSAEEHDAKRHGGRHHFPARVILRIFLTMRSRLMPRTRSRNSMPSR